jgi:pyruvate dehydrogenase E2 component (dihydrolipoamide acetyltransferase)
VGLITREPDEDISAYVAKEPSMASEAEGAGSATADEPVVPAVETTVVDRERIAASPRARRLAREEGADLAEVVGTGPNGRIAERDVRAYLEQRPEVTPVARRLAEREGIDIRTLEGTGSGGRITKDDVERALATQPEVTPFAAATAAAGAAVAEAPIVGVRARIARRMHESHRATAPVTLTTEVNASAFVALRETLKGSLSDELGFNLGYNDLLIKVVAHALREFPAMNAHLARDEADDLTGMVVHQFKRVHVGLAVDTDRGLLVPVVRDADQKRLVEIARNVRRLIERAQSGAATPDELSGGTFTITNLGMYDVDAFTPIINLPEVGVLGVGRIKPEPAVVRDEIEIQQRLWLSLTFDHRLVDGAPAARFLQRIKALIEEPYLLLA